MIGQASDDDAGGIASIYNHYIRNSVATFEETEVATDEMLCRMRGVRDSGFPWLVAREDERVIGYAYTSRWNPRAAYRHTAEVTIYLSPDRVARGCGTQLYLSLFSRLREKSIHAVVGGITLPNPASVAIHEKFGMKKVAHFEAVGNKLGEWLDVGYWQVILGAGY